MSIVYWCLHIWGDSIQAACSGNGQANFDKEFETMIDNGRETLHLPMVVIPSYQMAPLNPGNFKT